MPYVDAVAFRPVTPGRHVEMLAALAARGGRYAANLSTHTLATYAAARCYMSTDGLSGFAILADGELTNVWSLERGRGDAIVAAAVRRGATHLDCFAGHLSTLYARHGFVTYRSESNWDGVGPDVVYMRREDRAPAPVSAPIGDHVANVAAWDVAEDIASAVTMSCGHCPDPRRVGAYRPTGLDVATCDRCGHEISSRDVALEAGESLEIIDGRLAVVTR